MSTSVAVPYPQRRTRLAPLRLWTMLALAGGASALMYLQLSSIGIEPVLTAIAVLGLVFAALIATGRRWTPLLGAVWSVLVTAPNAQYLVYDLTHPALLDHFVFATIFVTLALIGFVAGIAATVQQERGRKTAASDVSQLGAPRWFTVLLAVFAGVSLGAILVAALAASSAASGVSAEALAQLPELATLPNAFDTRELHSRVGETVALRLANRDTTAHSFDIDELQVHTPLAAGASGLALFRPSAPGSYTFYCGIPGHREAGMAGTLIVEP